jgi:hypothetical protein
MTTVTINEYEIPVMSTIAELRKHSPFTFFRRFRTLDACVEYLLASFNPFTNRCNRCNKVIQRDTLFGYLEGHAEGATDLGNWEINLYKLETINPDFFAEHSPVIVKYLDVDYVIDFVET